MAIKKTHQPADERSNDIYRSDSQPDVEGSHGQAPDVVGVTVGMIAARMYRIMFPSCLFAVVNALLVFC